MQAPLALDHDDARLLEELVSVWNAKRNRNVLRTVYFEGKQAFKDFGISIPPQLQQFGTTLGWVAKGVNALVDRSNLEGFVSPGMVDDPYSIESVLTANQFYNEFPQAVQSSAIHACAFLTVSQGDVASGEPEALILPRAADASAGLWDSRRRAVRGFLAVVSVDEADMPTEMVMYRPEKVVTLTRQPAGGWQVDIRRNPLREVTVAPLVHKPDLKRPFGHSRISRAAMDYTDAALRTVLRSEVQAEGFSAPQYWLLGASAKAFAGNARFKAVMGRVFGLTENSETGEVPDVKRFEGASMVPHVDHLKMWAMLFCGDQGLSPSSLGIIHDNPSSAEAIYAAKEDLIIDARQANRSWGQGAVKAVQLAVRLRDGLDVTPEPLLKLTAMFTDPSMVSPTAAADAFTKRAAAIPGFAESEVGLETAGLTREQIVRFQDEQKRKAAGNSINALVAAAASRRAPAQEVAADGGTV
ncbi:phage portal protein [Arthrobacter sp. IA7]|uniref:phage portal protein n=1 Tax=Arthrobacter ipis TaxID=2716202 RepID=UPI00168605F2|nr:phage portal protein [Arthrobacter ipis]MBD1541030.1 phage portal protein [Arthrobacter ipis]